MSGFIFPANKTWTSYVPVVAPSAGAITSYTVNRAQYIDDGGVRFIDVDATITNNGTGSGHLKIDLPANPAFDFNNGLGREILASGFYVSAFGFAGNNYVRIVKLADGSYAGGTGYQISAQFWHRIS